MIIDLSAWEWPQYTLASLFALAMVINIVEHGTPRPPYNAWTQLSATCITSGLLYFGGFWS